MTYHTTKQAIRAAKRTYYHDHPRRLSPLARRLLGLED